MSNIKNKKESFMKGILTLMFAQVIIKILGLLYSLYLTNRQGFGDSGNAIYMSGYQIYAMLLTLSSTGVPNAIAKLISEKLALNDIKGANRVFKISFLTFSIIGITGTALLFFGADIIANKWLEIPEAKYTLMVLSPAIFFVSISSVIRGYFNGKQQMSVTAKSQTFEQVFKTCLTIIFVEIMAKLTSTNTELMAAGATVATTMATVFSFIYIYRLTIINKKEEKKENINVDNNNFKKESVKIIIKRILEVSIPISLSSLLSSINKNIDSFTVVRILKPILGETVAKVKYGILSGKVDILTSMPLAFNIAFATALVPVVAGAKIKNDIKTINSKLYFSILTTILIGLPCTVGMAMYASQILKLLFPNAESGGMLLAISAITIIFTVLAQTINGALQGLGKVRVPAIALGLGVLTKLIANIVLIPIEGIYENGAAIGSVLCHIVSFSLVYTVLRNTIKLEFKLSKIIIKPIIATIIMAIISYFAYMMSLSIIKIENICTILGIIIAVIVYAISVIILKIYTEEDILMLPKGEKILKILKKVKIY